MALVTRSNSAHMDATTAQKAPWLSGDLIAGEDLDPVAPCYIKASDGKVYMSNGTAANEAAGTDGFTPTSYKAGQPVTLFGKGTRFGYADADLTPGQVLYIAATKGRLDTSPTTGDDKGVAKAINKSDIRIVRDY